MIKIRCNNAIAVFTVLVLIVIIFISFYSMVKPFALTYNAFADTSKYDGYTNESSCLAASSGHWVNDACQGMPERASNLMIKVRYMWLAAPIILVLGLIIWMFVLATRKNPSNYYLGP